MRFYLVLVLLGTLTGGAWAQPQAAIRVGAVVPLSGAHAPTGAVQRAALEASVQALHATGVTLELTLADSRSSPEVAAVQAAALVVEGVHALICCTTPEEAARVTPSAAAAGLPVLTLAPPPTGGDAYWLFPLSAGEDAQLERLLLEATLHPFGLMAPAGQSGDLAETLLAPARVGTARYPPDRTPLTPEALWVATREPMSVVLWDEGAGTVRAAEALRTRGYAGDVMVRAAIWEQLNALERAKLTGARSVVSPALLGYTLADTHPSKAAVSSFRRALVSVPDGLLGETALAAGAAAWDAALLLGRAAEQVLVYSLGPADANSHHGVGASRSALRDALVGLGPVTGAGGSYDFQEDGSGGLRPDSLVLAEWRSGRLRPPP